MKKIITAFLCVAFVFGLCNKNSLASDTKALVGQTAYTRSNLKANGSTIYFHNMTNVGQRIPAGTEVVIIGAGTKYIKFNLPGGERKYKLEVRSSDYDKYFVEDVASLQIEGLNKKTKGRFVGMVPSLGMTKDEVYIIRGCPAWIGPGQKAWYYTFDQVMDSNQWYYNKNKGTGEMIVHFQNDVVSEIEDLT